MEPYNRRAKDASLEAAPPPARELITRIGPHDVLMGRGATSAYYQGNVRFRELVRSRKREYQSCKYHRHKQAIALDIYKAVASHGGRFLLRAETVLDRATLPNADTNGLQEPALWVQASHHVALEKIKQALRDNEPKQEAMLLRVESEVGLSDAVRVQAAAAAHSTLATTTSPHQVAMHNHGVPPLASSAHAPPADASRLWLHLTQQAQLPEPRHFPLLEQASPASLVSQQSHLADQILFRAQQPGINALPIPPQATLELLQLLEQQNQSRSRAPSSLGPPQLHHTLTGLRGQPLGQPPSMLHSPASRLDQSRVVAAHSGLAVREGNLGRLSLLSNSDLLSLLQQLRQQRNGQTLQMSLTEQFRQQHLLEQLRHMHRNSSDMGPALTQAAETGNFAHNLPTDAFVTTSNASQTAVSTEQIIREASVEKRLRQATPQPQSPLSNIQQPISARHQAVASSRSLMAYSLTGANAASDTASTPPTCKDGNVAVPVNPAAFNFPLSSAEAVDHQDSSTLQDSIASCQNELRRHHRHSRPSTEPTQAPAQPTGIVHSLAPQLDARNDGGAMNAAFLVALVRRYAESTASTPPTTAAPDSVPGNGNRSKCVGGDDKPQARRAAAAVAAAASTTSSSKNSNSSCSSSSQLKPRATKRPRDKAFPKPASSGFEDHSSDGRL
jgi:hypothetical protein